MSGNKKRKIVIISILYIFLFYGLLVFKQPNRELNKTYQKLENIKWVKPGGCGFVAYYVSDYLDSQNIKYDIVRLHIGRYENFHYMVKVGDYYIDKNGMFSRYHPLLLFLDHSIISKDSLRVRIDDPKIWNNKFDRADTSKLKSQILN